MNHIHLGLLTLVLVFVMFPLSDAYSAKFSCADNIDLQEYPFCKYVSEWNESEKFDDYVHDELVKRVDEINESPDLIKQIYLEIYEKVNKEHPGLEEKGEKMKDWIYEQVKNQ